MYSIRHYYPAFFDVGDEAKAPTVAGTPEAILESECFKAHPVKRLYYFSHYKGELVIPLFAEGFCVFYVKTDTAEEMDALLRTLGAVETHEHLDRPGGV